MVLALNQPSANTSIVLIQNKKETALKSLSATPMLYDTSFVGKWETKQTHFGCFQQDFDDVRCIHLSIFNNEELVTVLRTNIMQKPLVKSCFSAKLCVSGTPFYCMFTMITIIIIIMILFIGSNCYKLN